MIITAKELKLQSGKIIKKVQAGAEVIVTYRGKPSIKMIPIVTETTKSEKPSKTQEIFGIWKTDHTTKNPLQYVRDIRKNREL